MDVQWELDGLRFNNGIDSDGVEWVVESEIGWSGTSAPRTSRTARPGGHGSYEGPVYRSERIVELTCWAVADTWEARRRAEHRLAALCSEPKGLYPLLCTEEIGDLTAYVQLDDTIDPVIGRGGYSLRFAIQVAAPDSRKHGAWLSSGQVSLPTQPVGGLDATTVGGLDATTVGGLDAGGVGPTGLVSITNTGKAPAAPVITFYGPFTAPPELANVDTGEILRYTGTLGASEYVVINTDEYTVDDLPPRSVLLGGTLDRSGLLAIIGDWPIVLPGQTTTWAFRSADTTAGRAEVELRPAFW